MTLFGPSQGGEVTDTNGTAITAADAQELMSRWWHLYDEGRMDELTELFTEDASFHCRSDSGATPYEEFVTAHLSGRDEVMAWQRQHRADSPYPLRHHGTNFIVTERAEGQISFSSYLYVTQVENVVPVGVSSAVVDGTIRSEGGTLRLSEMHLVLDMTDSVAFKDRA